MGLVILILLVVALAIALIIPQKVLGFINVSNGVRRFIAVLIFLVAIALSYFLMEMRYQKDYEERQSKLHSAPIEHYADSIKKVYPNYMNNEVVCKRICADFEQWLGQDMDKLKGVPMRILGPMMEISGGYELTLTSDGDAHFWVIDTGISEDEVAKLNTSKTYQITGGKFVRYVEPPFLGTVNLGRIYVEDITIEEFHY